MTHPKRTSIFKNDTCELVVIKWNSGDVIPEHSHPGVNCYFSVLYGQIKEVRCGDKSTILNRSEYAYIDDYCGSHCVIATRESATIHFYIKTNLVCRL